MNFPAHIQAANCRPLQQAGYVFSVRSAAVLGSSNVSTPKTLDLYQFPPALKPAAPEDGRTPLNEYQTSRLPLQLIP